MRDHPQHGTTILGSGWGTYLKDKEVRQKWNESWSKAMPDEIMWSPRNAWGPDQFFLDRLILKFCSKMVCLAYILSYLSVSIP